MGIYAGSACVLLNLFMIASGGADHVDTAAGLNANPGLFVPLTPSISMEGVRTEVTYNGEIRQIILADRMDLDQSEDIAELRNIEMRFYENEMNTGNLKAGRGRMWLAARHEWGIAQNDIYMRDDVYYQGPNGMTLETPYIYYSRPKSTLRGDGGYNLSYIYPGRPPLIGGGDQFQITLNPGSNTLRSYELAGKPAHLTNSDKESGRP